jgi:membrane protease YdiL (CAAX protease family)
MSFTSLQRILWSQSRLPADFPLTPKAAGVVYGKSLLCYIIGSFAPVVLFFGFMYFAASYYPNFAVSIIGDGTSMMPIVVMSVISFLTGFGLQMLYVRSRLHKEGRTMRDVLALNRKNFGGSWALIFASGLLTFVIAAGLEQGFAAIWPFALEDKSGEFIGSLHGMGFTLMALLAVFGPFFEEVIFRGFLYNGLRTSLHARLAKSGLSEGSEAYARRIVRYDILAAFLSALMFGVAHFNPAGLPLYIISGMVFAEAYRRSGSLWVSIAGHFVNNGVLVLFMLFSH